MTDDDNPVLKAAHLAFVKPEAVAGRMPSSEGIMHSYDVIASELGITNEQLMEANHNIVYTFSQNDFEVINALDWGLIGPSMALAFYTGVQFMKERESLKDKDWYCPGCGATNAHQRRICHYCEAPRQDAGS